MRTANLILSLKSYWSEYTNNDYQAAMQPLEIICEVSGPVAGYDNVMLDGLLARLVVDEATEGNLLDDSQSPYLLPVPLKMMWRHPETELPLWAANQLNPVSANKNITIWWHKRFIRNEHTEPRKGIKKSAISKITGRFKEKRTPMPAKIATVWHTTCIGNKNEISRLLAKCNAIGKKRQAVVKRWLIRGIDSFQFERHVPIQYLYDDNVIALDMSQKSWTPPYWVGVPETRGWCVIPE